MDDQAILNSESRTVVERIAALDRLLAAGAGGLESTLARWLEHENAMLRGNALRGLIGRLHLDAYVPVALEWLTHAEDSDLRSDAAYALGRYVEHTGRQRERILGELARQLVTSDETTVKYRCYQAILHGLGEGFASIPFDFDMDRDVDWRIVSPLLAEKM